ncbi:hypothetical protein O6H91_14G036500 [Diphasiastrum complanatum]|uniref:Uncharacterized protein n=1 Tax=Diphasiastrum complanatum TaxID=34168 RepID=A0ACC2BNE7_DIPCM|nr:hypothetical protein O6H91_14G036500 [Diphasiastrum complanatum]
MLKLATCSKEKGQKVVFLLLYIANIHMHSCGCCRYPVTPKVQKFCFCNSATHGNWLLRSKNECAISLAPAFKRVTVSNLRKRGMFPSLCGHHDRLTISFHTF